MAANDTDERCICIYRVPSGTWKPAKSGDLNIICPGLEIAWNLSPKVRKPEQNKKTLAENLDKTWNVKIYNISILYRDNFFQVFYSCDFRTHLASAFWCKNCLQYNLENGFFDLDKPGDNLEFLGKKNGNPDITLKVFPRTVNTTNRHYCTYQLRYLSLETNILINCVFILGIKK